MNPISSVTSTGTGSPILIPGRNRHSRADAIAWSSSPNVMSSDLGDADVRALTLRPHDAVENDYALKARAHRLGGVRGRGTSQRDRVRTRRCRCRSSSSTATRSIVWTSTRTAAFVARCRRFSAGRRLRWVPATGPRPRGLGSGSGAAAMTSGSTTGGAGLVQVTAGFGAAGGFVGAGAPPPPRAAGRGSGIHTRCSGVSRVTAGCLVLLPGREHQEQRRRRPRMCRDRHHECGCQMAWADSPLIHSTLDAALRSET